MKKISDVMTKNVQCLSPETNLRDLAAKMKEIDCGAIPICEEDRLIGMVTDRDIVLRTLASGRDPNSCTARDVMTSPIVFGFQDQDIGEAARIMEAKEIRRIAILNRNKRLVGIVSLGDIATRGANEEIAVELLERVSEHTKGARGAA